MPAAAVPALIVSVALLPVTTDDGLMLAVAPVGTPETDKEIDSGLPDTTAVLMVEVPDVAGARERLVGNALIEKSFVVVVMVNVTVVECVALGLVPVTTIEYVPTLAVPVSIARVELPPVATDAGLKLALAPSGTPETESEMFSALPDITAVLMLEVAEVPGARDRFDGDALIEKSLTAGPQDGNLKVPIRVLQLNDPVAARYSFVYQNVQSSLGSTAIML